MLRLAAVVLVLAQCSSAATLSGIVADISGTPIQNARVDHIGKQVVIGPVEAKIPPSPDEIRTDARGHFSVTTVVPAIVIRAPGYQSQRVMITEDAELTITLRPLSLPPCKIERLPAIKMQSANDADYTEDIFYVETKNRRRGVRGGHGPMYSFGAPSDRDVCTSVDYFEVMSLDGEIDGRGHSADGKYRRMLTFFGFATHYFGVEEETAEILDCIIDKVI
jgi:hypothetical protein